MKQEHIAMRLGRAIGIVMFAVLAWDIITGGDLSRLSRVLIISIAACTYLAVFIKQCRIAWRYEGAPLNRPIAFRWVVAQWFGMTGCLIAWFLLVALVPGAYNTTISAVIWALFAQSTLYFFSRWLAVGRPQLAGPGETGVGKGS